MDVAVTLAEEKPMNSSVLDLEDVPPPLASAYEKPEKQVAIQEKISRYANVIESDLYDSVDEPSCSSAWEF